MIRKTTNFVYRHWGGVSYSKDHGVEYYFNKDK